MFNIESWLAKISEYMPVDLSEQETGSNSTVNQYKSSVFDEEKLLGVGDDLVLNNNNTPDTPNKEDELQAKREFIQKKLEETGNKRGFWQDDLNLLLELKMEDLEKVSDLFYIDGRNEQLSASTIVTLAKLTDERFEQVKILFDVENRGEEFYDRDVSELIKLSYEEFERAKKLFHVENREEEFDGYTIARLAKLSDEQIEWAKQNLFTRYPKQWNGGQLNIYIQAAKNKSNEILEYLDSHEYLAVDYTLGNEIKFIDGKKTYTYDQTGLIETSETEKLPNESGYTNITKKTIFNKKLNVKQVLIEGIPVGSERGKKRYIRESLTYYDVNGNVIRTVNKTTTRKSGFLSVSETDREGRTVPIQWESIDQNTGTTITERHMTSPEGLKTEYYAEESDNLKVTDYKIIDSDGKALINIYQTFERIDENKFISSINATGNSDDTQIYEIEYIGNVVKIFDRKNNKTTEIDLNNYFENEESAEKLLPIIRMFPGHILLKLANDPIGISYEKNLIENARLYGGIQIGNYENLLYTSCEEEKLFATIMHEFGHYLDRCTGDFIENNPVVITIYQQEFQKFISSTTTEQQNILKYFTDPRKIPDYDPKSERIAETHAILNSINEPQANMRRLYLAQYFPRTMAAIMQLLLKEEGVEV